ncbi:Uncharacterized protein BP5553_09851 [Venustampulla echinocandica]|uniref:C2H2 and C2HC zinc finger n=1 Tax=Venustampulla echinocandica TaxID=2656787 RepID=A0A370TAW9_9HELO|nr:Uncharacterized protein BP5553_09851 [Venustampulla echinocandica]RDL31062.1 Uncharacterized protein BP5553_09851 [Venustampulla echinocandica]
METEIHSAISADPDPDPNPNPNPNPNRGGPNQIQPGPFKCNVCQRTYARIDHLSRHFRSHTSEKPYRCEVCFKTFSRSDLLKRHALAHPSNRRHRKSHSPCPRRVSQACKACAAAKLKCKEEKPCQRCEAKGITCEYNEIDARTAGSWQSQPPSCTQNASHREVDSSLSEDTLAPTSNRGRGESALKNGHHVPNPPQSQVGDGTNTPMFSPIMDNPSAELIECDENMFADFLRDVMMPTPSEQFNSQPLLTYAVDTQSMACRDLLSFGLESNLELNDQDYSLMDFYQSKDLDESYNMKEVTDNPSSRHEPLTPQSDTPIQNNTERLALGTKAFRSSLWCWTPVRADTGSIEQHNITLHPSEMSSPTTYFSKDMHVNTDNFDSTARDKIVAMVLSTTPRQSFEKVMSGFPSVELQNNLLHSFLASHMAQPDTWIHSPTLRIGRQRPELLAGIISSGAVLSTSVTIRKLGFAIHEAVRHSLPKVCEENNSATRDLGLLQAIALNLDVGLWSGNKRKIELAESHAGMVITMCRRASRFLRSSYRAIVPLESDDGEVLENKWRSWAHQESLKRLVFFLFTRDAQTSISLIVPTLISYAELSLPLPEPRSLFLARTANEWKSTYLSQTSSINTNERIPSLQQCLHEISPLTSPSIHARIDTALSLSIIAYGIWGLILEYRQLSSVTKAYPPSHLSSSLLVLEHRHQELCQLLQLFSISSSELGLGRDVLSGTALQSKMLTELLLTHLHVSFDNLQLFAGREGEEEARRVYPSLQRWAASREARTAVFHAGQVVRYAKLLSHRRSEITGMQGGVRGFFAVAVYHASLTFWAVGVLGIRPGHNHDSQQPELPTAEDRIGVEEGGGNNGEELVWLDVEESSATKSFIALGRGVPCFSTTGTPGADDSTPKEVAKLCEPGMVMSAMVKVLRGTSGDEDEDAPPPPLVENLSQLMRELGDAARGIGVR